VPLAGNVFDEAHIAGPQVRLGPIAGFNVDLTIYSDGELPAANTSAANANTVLFIAVVITPSNSTL
jgi:hypothetical protein